MPLMKLACTALDRVPLTRPKIIEHLMKKFSQDLVFCRAPEDNVLTSGVYGMLFIHKSDAIFSFDSSFDCLCFFFELVSSISCR
jgi:hypothetical protein